MTAVTALVWTVPVVAAVAALVLVLAWSRRLEELTTDLVREVSALPEVRSRFVRLRHELDRSEPLVHRTTRHWD